MVHTAQASATAAAADAESVLTAVKAEADSVLQKIKADADTASTSAAEKYASLQQVLDAVNLQKADLEGKVAKAAGALNAAEELKEARWAYV